MRKGLFLAFEGIDGSGKSTQIRLLNDRLLKEGCRVYQTCEPSGGPIGSQIRQILTGRMKADSRVIAALFAADRLDHLLNDINGMAARVEEGITVLTDRYYFSSYAYHSVDVPMDWVIAANEESRKVLKPDLNIFIDIDADTAMERITRNRFLQELFEKKSLLEKIRANYLKAFELFKDSEKVLVVDGKKNPKEIAEVIWNGVKRLNE
ncbi:MAG: dTMP kinase [Lachnospiraceae bacterium]|nr:dTMP kinase [Lachnospiraceae bacterium]